MASYKSSRSRPANCQTNTHRSTDVGFEIVFSSSLENGSQSLLDILRLQISKHPLGAFSWIIHSSNDGLTKCQVYCQDGKVRESLAKCLAKTRDLTVFSFEHVKKSHEMSAMAKLPSDVSSEANVITPNKARVSNCTLSTHFSRAQQIIHQGSISSSFIWTPKNIKFPEKDQSTQLCAFAETNNDVTLHNCFKKGLYSTFGSTSNCQPVKTHDHLSCGPFDCRIRHAVAENHTKNNITFRGHHTVHDSTARGCLPRAGRTPRAQTTVNPKRPETVKIIEQQGKDKKPSTVVFIKGLTFSDISLESIVNLFECFGNVQVAMYHIKRQYALVKYTTIAEAKTCIKEMYGKEIWSGKGQLLLHYSEFEDISPKYFSNEKAYYVSVLNQRYKAKTDNVGHLSRTLLVTIHPYDLRKEPNKSKVVGALRRLLKKSPKSTGISNEYTVEFSGIKSSIAFAMQHNFRELIEGEAFITLNFAPKNTFIA